MTMLSGTRVVQHPLTGENYASDREIMGEIAELVSEVGDVRYGSAVLDPLRHQITARLEDGRTMRLTVMFV